MRRSVLRPLVAILLVGGSALAGTPASAAAAHHHLRNLRHSPVAGHRLFADGIGPVTSDQLEFIGRLTFQPLANGQIRVVISTFECSLESDSDPSSFACTLGFKGKTNSNPFATGTLEVRSADGQINSTNFEVGISEPGMGFSGTESSGSDGRPTAVSIDGSYLGIGVIDSTHYVIEGGLTVTEQPSPHDPDS
jgi:hypothetical protein